MRSSDGISYVCSSDLPRCSAMRVAAPILEFRMALERPDFYVVLIHPLVQPFRHGVSDGRASQFALAVSVIVVGVIALVIDLPAVLSSNLGHDGDVQIGRAQCRERVCQYV